LPTSLLAATQKVGRNKSAQFRQEFLWLSGVGVPELRGLVPAYVSPFRIAELANGKRH